MADSPAAPPRGLTDQEIEVLGTLASLTQTLGRPPRRRELAEAMGYSHGGSLAKPLIRLRALDLIERRPPGRYPGIQLVRPEGRQLRRFRTRGGRTDRHAE